MGLVVSPGAARGGSPSPQATRAGPGETDISLDLCGEAEDASETPKKGGLKAKLVRPTTVDQFYGVLNMWVMVCEATCIAPCLVTTAFLDQVAFKPMREG